MSKRTFTESLKAYCNFAGLTYNPASVTGQKEDGEKFVNRINDKPVVCLYIGSADHQQTDAALQQAIDQELPF